MHQSSLISYASAQVVDWITADIPRAAEALPQDLIEKVVNFAPQEKRDNRFFYARINLLPTVELEVPSWRIDSVALKALRFKDVQKLDITNTLSFNEGLITVSKCCPKLRSLTTNFYPQGLSAVFQRCLFLTELTLTGSRPKYPPVNFFENKLKALVVKITSLWEMSENLHLAEVLRKSPFLDTLTVEWADGCTHEFVNMNHINQIALLKNIKLLNANVSCSDFRGMLNFCQKIESLTITSGCTGTSTVTQICRFGGRIKKLHLEGFAYRHELNNSRIEDFVNQQYQLLLAAVPGMEVTLTFKERDDHQYIGMTHEDL